jgi:tetratricopeptide (TPR) repeat protein/transglutaminase-like putative cysteine protease
MRAPTHASSPAATRSRTGGRCAGPAWLLCLAGCLLAIPPLRGAPWDGAAFAASPEAIREAVDALPAAGDDPVLVLLDDCRVELDAQGRSTATYRLVYWIRSTAGLSEWSSVAIDWAPWYQERPEIRARVVDAAGRAYTLDPATLSETPASQYSQDIFSDSRVLQAPLPGLGVGAVVEERIVVRDSAPMFDAGMVQYLSFGMGVPVLRSRLVIDADAGLPLRHVTRLLPQAEIRRSEGDGRVLLTFEVGRIEALEYPEALTPYDEPSWPHVAFSTGESWSAVASRYHRIVESRLASTEVRRIARKIAKRKPSREEALDAVLASLHAAVRYTGLEFGESSIVPYPPDQMWQRRYGDCKDQATAVVAMLRETGVEAHLALLSAGFSSDVEPELPGLGAFDHAIVYVPGTPPLWADPTDRFARAGELPLADQGRLALVASPETVALIRTPEAAAGENRVVETREVFLAERGPARIVETSRADGSIGRDYRHSFVELTTGEVRESLESYAQSSYGVERLTDYEVSDPENLDEPFLLRIEVEDTPLAVTVAEEASVALDISSVLERLPLAVLGGDDALAGDYDPAGDADLSPRKTDLVLTEPYVFEVHYVLIPPPGFEVVDLPDDDVTSIGAMTLTRKLETRQDGSVHAGFVFDTSKRRFTPSEVDAARRAIREMAVAPVDVVEFRQIGESHLAAGEIGPALEAFRELAALHPDEALHRAQIARALLEGGLGDVARSTAREAIALEPDSAVAHQTLGWILQHDLIGRRFGKGFDLEDSIAAYRRARELDPDDWIIRGDLAILLEHDARGVRYGADAALGEAVAEYHALRGDLQVYDFDLNLLVALMWAERFDEVTALAEELDHGAESVAIRLVAIAAQRGAEEAVRRGARLLADAPRRTAYATAGDLLVALRRYPEAAVLLKAGARGAPNAVDLLARADLVRKVRRHEELHAAEDAPRRVVRRLLEAIIGGGDFAQVIPDLFSRETRERAGPEATTTLKAALTSIRSQTSSLGQNPETVLDVVLSTARFGVDGDDTTGYRVEVVLDYGSGSATQAFHVVREDGSYRIAGGGFHAPEVGRRALALIERGHLDPARRLLDWARREVPAVAGEDPYGGPLLARFWTEGGEGDAEAARLAAAVLLAADPVYTDEAISLLGPRREGLDDASEQAPRLDLALALAYSQGGRPEALLPVAERLARTQPRSDAALFLLTRAYSDLGDWEGLERMLRQRLEAWPDNDQATRILAGVVGRGDDLEQSSRLLRRLVDHGRATAIDYNNLAWNALAAGAVDDQALVNAQRAVRESGQRDRASLHTLASVYAELGRTTEAREFVLRSMVIEGLDQPDSVDWFVFGRIAEHYGVRDAATAMYRKVAPPENEVETATSTYRLAQRRLGILESPAPD